jgi:hypothetical protein
MQISLHDFKCEVQAGQRPANGHGVVVQLTSAEALSFVTSTSIVRPSVQLVGPQVQRPTAV